ncbi:MAG TPA: methenyltetrahydromethanopterin cyclohydrolase [Chloroflexi bacterium]|nr:methenyltetrahydromethanopterin cyclohydrolase [Chloroflexota bacterium]
MSEISINKRAAAIAEQMIADAEALGVEVKVLSNGAKVINAAGGGLKAGKLFAEVCMGGLGEVNFTTLDFGSFWLPGVSVSVEKPLVACMASQYAGWAIKVGKFFAMGSGPARALSCVEELYQKLSYKDESDVAVIALEVGAQRAAPLLEEVAEYIARKCGVSPDKLYILIAPTASVVGSVQIAARVVETGMHKMMELGFDIECITSGYGTCPIAPIAEDDLKAIGRTNDCVLYGGRAFYTVQAEDAEIERVIEQIPSSASRDYGKPFYELFQAYGGDFYKIDPFLFSPAEVLINNLASGKTYHAGGLNLKVLRGLLE